MGLVDRTELEKRSLGHLQVSWCSATTGGPPWTAAPGFVVLADLDKVNFIGGQLRPI
jgi:hypothetical protein